MKAAEYRNYLLGVLLIILAWNSVDRLALGLVMQNVKADLSLSDTQLGFLTGIAFAFFYSLMGIPIARWADSGNRVMIIAITTAVWSLAVTLCGMATSFVQLLLIRTGVAVGEAGCIPPAHSLIADYFNRAERPAAIARYMLGGPLSVVIGFLFAGWLNEFYGWRMTFVLIGLPGIALAALTWLTLREPRNRYQSLQGSRLLRTVQDSSPSFREVCATLWGSATFRNLVVCFSVLAFFNYGIVQWKPAFFIRSFGLQTGELGTWFAVIYGVGGGLGTYFGGVWASRKAAHNEGLQLKATAVVLCAFALVSALIYLSPTYHLAFAFMSIATAGSGAATGPLLATIQSLVPERMRATSVALLYLFANLIGMGLGPFAVGILSDALRAKFGEESLRYALLALCPGYVWAAWHLWQAGKTVAHDLREMELDLPRAG